MAEIKEVIKEVLTKKGYNKGEPLSSFSLSYDSDSNQLEPTYYWILDFMTEAGINVEKITDNFMASPGSGQFSEFGNKATAMQQQATKLLADTNTLIKTILNLVYDLKEFEIRLENYKKAQSDDPKEKEEGMLGLKQIWLDNVDIKRGRGSVNSMSYEMGFTTLREAFVMANTVQDIENMASKDGTINDQVKRALIPRLSEFLTWKDKSKEELEKRFAIEKSYLRSEVKSLEMYTKWARPYLKAAEELRMKGFEGDAALVAAFSTSMFQITLLGKKTSKSPPKKFKDTPYKMKRAYNAIYIVDVKYRGELAQKATQRGDYAFGYGGKVDMTFNSYVLNEDELSLVKKKLADADVTEGLKLIENNTQVALDQLKSDLDRLLVDDKKETTKKKEAEKQNDSNPFTALIDLFKGGDLFKFSEKKDKKEIKEPKDIDKDNFMEEALRKEVASSAIGMLYTIYDVYKKAHMMASSPEKFDNGNK